MFRLVISDDAGKTTVVNLVRDEITIGRAEDNHICLTERNVSRHHAKLVRRDGTFGVDDLGSYNGVKVNGARIEGSAALEAGDKVGIGDYQLRFETDARSRDENSDETEGEEPLPARLVLLTAPAAGAEFALSRLPARLGRSEEVDITVNHRSISREHAEFVAVDGDLVVKDLGSANGVRVNGEDVQEATLDDGDVLELGQVRLRYVARGTEFIFDPDAPDVDAAESGSEGPRPQVIAAVLFIVVAVAAAAAIATKVARTPRPELPVVANASAEPTAEDRAREVQAAITACRTSLAADRWDEAIAHASRAIAVDPTASEAHDCRADANAGANAESIGRRAVELFGQGDVIRAYGEVSDIPADNAVRLQEDVVQIAQAYADLKIAEARAAIAERRGRAASVAVAEAQGAIRDYGLVALEQVATGLATRAQALPQEDLPAAEGVDAGVEPAAVTPTDLTAAEACFAQNDVDCVLVATEGMTTLGALDLRFRALRRAQGRRAEAVRAARALVLRYPNSRPAARAQEFLEPRPAPTP